MESLAMGFPLAASTASVACAAVAWLVPGPEARTALALLAVALAGASFGWLAQDAAGRAAHEGGGGQR